jgi:hypothetical protein
VSCVSEYLLERNRSKCLAPPPIGRGHLAVVGGGPSIESRIVDLMTHEGDVWAINEAWRWCRDHGVDADFYSADPSPHIADICRDAPCVLADHVNPECWNMALPGARAVKGPYIGPSSACSTLRTAIDAGYRKVTYYGCESSWNKSTHAYEDNPGDDWLCVCVDGKHFLTNLHLLSQAEVIAEMIAIAPEAYKEKSGGLLAALVKNPEWDAVFGNSNLVARLTEKAA